MSLFLSLQNKQRWGFVVYRTDYSSERDWTKFQTMLNTWTLRFFDEKKPEEVSLIHAWQQMWYFDDESQFENASIEQLREHYRGAWLSSLPSEERDDKWPEQQLFLVADKEVLDHVGHFHVELTRNPLGEYPFIKAFDKYAPKPGDDYPAWMKVKIPAVFYLYEVPLHLGTKSMRALRPRDTDWFKRDDCYYPEDTYADAAHQCIG
ncbi:hypothetical protein E4T49_07405 [Aureobasidium sp. EXF-10728]|nr:hypothetical protein E4T49_07405 [Aureobasidium sp. EXF-10728]